MLGQRIAHPKSTKFYDGDHGSPTRPSKRRKKDNSANTSPSKQSILASNRSRDGIPDSDAESDNGEVLSTIPNQTDLESALLPIRTDQEAIDEYETLQAAERSELGTIEGRLNDRTWTRGKTSIYVDAFNLALRTVLDEESHLFDEAEKELFKQWNLLSYEAQYL
jgi:fanconi-associated nuclease 1